MLVPWINGLYLCFYFQSINIYTELNFNLMKKPLKVLVYGYGNPGRQDDGIGNEMVDMLNEWIPEHDVSCIETDSNYQLNIEDAEKVSENDVVIFVDASKEDISEYKFSKVIPSGEKVEFTMHAVSPGFVVDLSKKLFNKTPDAYLLQIRGYEWDFKEGLSANAKLNLEQAYQFLTRKLSELSCIRVNKSINMLD